METENNRKRPPVPYIPFKTFLSFLANTKGKLPDKIDPSVLMNMSGTARSQLLSALKSLALIAAEGIVQDSLRQLSEAYDTPEWKNVLAAFLQNAYADVIGELNVATATPAMVRDRFKNFGGVEGGTVENAIRFYISALKEADLPYSPYLVVRQRAPRGSNNSSARKRVSRKAAEQEEEEEIDIADDLFPVSLGILGIGGHLRLPTDLSLDQWEAVNEYVKTVINLRERAQNKS